MTGEMAKILARKYVRDERDVLELAMDFLQIHKDGYIEACADLDVMYQRITEGDPSKEKKVKNDKKRSVR